MHKAVLYIRTNFSILVGNDMGQGANWLPADLCEPIPWRNRDVCEYMETRRTHLRLNAELGSYDKKVVHALIDEVPMCHVSAVVDGTPYIQATVHWREGESVYIHGAVKNKMIKAISQGSQACLAFSHFGGNWKFTSRASSLAAGSTFAHPRRTS